MQLVHSLTLRPPFEINDVNPHEVIDSDGSIIANCKHIFISEIVVESLNNFYPEETTIAMEELIAS